MRRLQPKDVFWSARSLLKALWGGVSEAGLQALLPSLADITVICPWEAFSHLELHELAQFGII